MVVVAYHGGARALGLGALPPRLHPRTSLAGRSGWEQQRSGREVDRICQGWARGPVGGWVFLYIATRQPAAERNGLLGWAGRTTWLPALYEIGIWAVVDQHPYIKALFSLQKFLVRGAVAFSFVCGKYCPIMD